MTRYVPPGSKKTPGPVIKVNQVHTHSIHIQGIPNGDSINDVIIINLKFQSLFLCDVAHLQYTQSHVIHIWTPLQEKILANCPDNVRSITLVTVKSISCLVISKEIISFLCPELCCSLQSLMKWS